jgi:uncharacterized protein
MIKQGTITLSNTQVEDLEIVKEIILSGLDNFKVKVYLFGSFATGKAGRTSDIDVAVLPLESLPVGLLSEIRDKLEESNALYPVDLVDLLESDASFKERVIKEGIIWKE